MRIDIKYKLTAPLSHIGESASVASYFQTILTHAGKLPVVTANSVRGQLRNSGAAHLLQSANMKVDKEVFHVLFSGGNLLGTMKNDIEKAIKVREVFPFVSVFGGALGDIIMSGKLDMSFLYPVCAESESITKIRSELSWRKLIGEIDFSRMDDEKNDKLTKYIVALEVEKQAKASTQMRYTVQYMAAGTEFSQFTTLTNETELEKGALYNAFFEWFKNPKMGGMANKGFGFFDAEMDGLCVKNGEIELSNEVQGLIESYTDYVKSIDYTQFINLLKGVVKKDVKKTNKAIEDNGEAD